MLFHFLISSKKFINHIKIFIFLSVRVTMNFIKKLLKF